jgi:hypothetical protein
MNSNRQAAAHIRTYVDYQSEEFSYHITVFRGIKAGITITLVLFWFPFVTLFYFFGWLHLLAYGALLIAIFAVLGLICRCFGLVRPNVHSKPSAEAIGS